MLCCYDFDCEPLADLRTDAGGAHHDVKLVEMRSAWFLEAAAGREPASWRIAARLMARGYAGLLTPSFAPGATQDAHAERSAFLAIALMRGPGREVSCAQRRR